MFSKGAQLSAATSYVNKHAPLPPSPTRARFNQTHLKCISCNCEQMRACTAAADDGRSFAPPLPSPHGGFSSSWELPGPPTCSRASSLQRVEMQDLT